MAKQQCYQTNCVLGPGGPTNGCGQPATWCVAANDGNHYTINTVPCAECQALFGGIDAMVPPLGLCQAYCQLSDGPKPVMGAGPMASVDNSISNSLIGLTGNSSLWVWVLALVVLLVLITIIYYKLK